MGATTVGAPASVGATVGAAVGATTVGALVSASPKGTSHSSDGTDPPYGSRPSCIKVRLNQVEGPYLVAEIPTLTHQDMGPRSELRPATWGD